MHRVLKAQYFLKSDFLGAKLGPQKSYAWRSMIAAQKLVKQGCSWQVGDGTLIGIWNDKWLHGPSSFSVISRPNTNLQNSRVSTLIEPSTHEWRIEFVNQNFLPGDAQSILGTPVSLYF